MEGSESAKERIDTAKIVRLMTVLREANEISEGDNSIVRRALEYFCNRNPALELSLDEEDELRTRYSRFIDSFLQSGAHVKKSRLGTPITTRDKDAVVTSQLDTLIDGLRANRTLPKDFFIHLDRALGINEEEWEGKRPFPERQRSPLARYVAGGKFKSEEFNELIQGYLERRVRQGSIKERILGLVTSVRKKLKF